MLPRLNNIPPKSNMIINGFKGINVTNSYTAGELTDSNNMDTASYPALGSRKKRTLCSECDGIINGAGCFNGYFYTYYTQEDEKIFLKYGGEPYEFTEFSDSEDFTQKRKFAFLENAIVIIPDNVIFFVDTLKFKSTDISIRMDYDTVNQKFKEFFDSPNGYMPTEYEGIGRVLSNRVVSLCVKNMSGTTGTYDFYPSAFDDDIEAGDVITIKMKAFNPNGSSVADNYYETMKKLENGVTLKVKELVKTTSKAPGGKYITETTELVFDDNAILTEQSYVILYREISIEKKMPALTHITSHNNRVWGVSENKIYASRLGDGDEWNDFSVDSYGIQPSASFTASAGTDGNFTGIIPHGNYIYAFKENYIHKIYGDTPEEYTISNIDALGCLENTDTLCLCGMYLMYASCSGICILREGYPKVVSEKIGKIAPVCAAACGNKFYLLCDTNDGRCIYVYDIIRDIWQKESCSADTDNLCADRGSICCSEGGRLIYLSSGNGEESENEIDWDFCMRFDTNSFSENTAVSAAARISLEENSSFTVRVIYDDGTKSGICGFCYDETVHGSAILRFPIKRDLGFTVEFSGVGGFTLRNIRFNYYKSSEE